MRAETILAGILIACTLIIVIFNHKETKPKIEISVIGENLNDYRITRSETINGYKDGVEITLDYYGNILLKCNYKNDLKNGDCIEYAVDGDVLKAIEYKNGDYKEDVTNYYK